MKYIAEAVGSHKISGDGEFTKRCNAWLEERFHANKVMLTTSGSTALDMAFELCELRSGDEVILPSYTFSSTANAAVLCGARLVFADIRPDTMNIDEKRIEAAITDRTKVICCVHYAGVACEMDAIMDIARRHGLMVIEDADRLVLPRPGRQIHLGRLRRQLPPERDQRGLSLGAARDGRQNQRGQAELLERVLRGPEANRMRGKN